MQSTSWGALIDSANAAGGGFEPLPVGDYEVQATGVAKKETSNGKLMYDVEFTVLSGPHAGRKVWNNFVVSPESDTAMSIFFRHMAAFGLTADFFRSEPSADAVASNLMNKRVIVTNKHKVHDGTTRNEIKGVKPHPQGPTADAVAMGAAPVAAPPQLPVAPPAPVAPAPAPVAAPVPVAPAPAPVAAPVPVAPAPVPPAAPVAPVPVDPSTPPPAPVF